MQIGINIFVSFLLQPKLKIFQKYFTRKIVTSAQKCQFKKTIGGFLGFFGRFFGQFFFIANPGRDRGNFFVVQMLFGGQNVP
jgi:hypothetical protein